MAVQAPKLRKRAALTPADCSQFLAATYVLTSTKASFFKSSIFEWNLVENGGFKFVFQALKDLKKVQSEFLSPVILSKPISVSDHFTTFINLFALMSF